MVASIDVKTLTADTLTAKTLNANLPIVGGTTVSLPLTSSMVDGNGPAIIHTRATTKTIIDHEGILRTCLSGEVGFTGGRRVRNHIAYSEDLSNGVWSQATAGSGSITINANGSATCTTTGGGGRMQLFQDFTLEAGRSYRVTMNITDIVNGDTAIRSIYGLYNGDTTPASGSAISPIKSDNTEGRYVGDVIVVDGPDVTVRLIIGVGVSATEVAGVSMTFSNIMIEDVTGQANQTPGEYVSTNVESDPFHGAGVDGVKWFEHASGNSISVSTLVEARGFDLPVTGAYRHALINHIDQPFTRTIDDTRLASSWTNFAYNDIGDGTHTFSGTGDSTVLLDAPTPASSRAIAAINFDGVSGQSYVFSVNVVSCVNPGAANNTLQASYATSLSAGVGNINIPDGATGRYGFRYTAGTTETQLLRFGCGINGAVDAVCSITLTDPMIQKVSSLTVPFIDYTDVPVGLTGQGGYTFASGNSGAFVATDDHERFVNENNPFDFMLGVGDSFANDINDWPQQMQKNSYTGAFHGKGYSGQRLTGTIGSSFAADISAYDYGGIVLQGGVNDIIASTTAAAMITAVTTMIGQAKSANRRLMIMGISPWKNYTSWTAGLQTVTDDYNTLLEALCKASNVIYLNVYDLLEDPANADELLPAYDSGDGLHPGSAGAIVIADYVYEKIPADYLAGALLEAQVTNECHRSEDFSLTWVSPDTTITTDVVAAPNGAMTADKITEDNTTAIHLLYCNNVIRPASVETWTATIYAKKAENTTFEMRLASGSGAKRGVATFDLDAGTVGTATHVTWTASKATIEPVGNDGWYRCRVTVTTDGVADGTRINIYMQSGSYLGDGTSGFYIWGAQLELGGFPTSYIMTLINVAVQRNADTAVRVDTPSAFNDAEGAMLLTYTPSYNTADLTGQLGLLTTAANGRFFYIHSSLKRVTSYDGVNVLDSGVTLVAGTQYKLGIRWFGSTAEIYMDGVLVKAGNYDGTWQTSNILFLNTLYANTTTPGTAEFKDLRVYPAVVSSAEMIRLTL